VRRYKADRSDTAARQQVRSELSRIHALNRDAIVRANDQTYQMADGYGTLLAIIGTLAALLGFTFVVNFPDYVARPVARLKAGIVEITQKNYATRIHEHSHDEFGDVTYAFNQMAEQLEQWEKSNMASVIRANQRLEAIIALLPDAAIGLDEQEKILFVNPAAADLLALRPESVVGRSAPEVATHHDLLREILQTEGEVGGKKSIFNIFSAGEARKFALHSFVVTNREGGHLGRVWYLQLQSL
jgi:two-component system, NtrC family, sensor histidine kinase KinB